MAAVAVGCAVAMLSAKNPVHSALWLVGNFVALAVIYLILSAPVLFAIQMIVYAGAIMVLFLFVIMFFMAPRARQWLRPPLAGQLTLGGILAVVLLLLLMWGLGNGAIVPSMEPEQPPSAAAQAPAGEEQGAAVPPLGQPVELGKWLFTWQVLPFELTSLLLLAALLGAVMIARDVASEGRERGREHAPVVHDRQAGGEG